MMFNDQCLQFSVANQINEAHMSVDTLRSMLVKFAANQHQGGSVDIQVVRLCGIGVALSTKTEIG